MPDLFVANDFGSSQLYRNNGDGTFTVVSKQAHVESVGAGMSCCWADYDNDGRQDIYVPSMWEAAGQRVSEQAQFHQKAPQSIRELYQRHARGNALYRNSGDGTFQNAGREAGVEMGRWSWCSDFWDFDHDGYPGSLCRQWVSFRTAKERSSQFLLAAGGGEIARRRDRLSLPTSADGMRSMNWFVPTAPGTDMPVT